MRRRLAATVLSGWLAAFLASPVGAVDVGPAATISFLDAWLSVEDTVHFNVNGTLTVDRSEDRIRTISVADGVNGVIDFEDTAFEIRFPAGASFITLGAGSTLTVLGGILGSGFDLADLNPGGSGTLTINGSIAGNVLGNTIRIGDNLLVTANQVGLHLVLATNGSIEADGPTSIAGLDVDPGAGESFTWTGPATGTIDTLVMRSGTFAKTGTGTLTLTNGFDLGAGAGIRLAIQEGTLIDAGAATLVFGDDAERVTVSAGASCTLSRDITCHAGPATNLEAAAGSTVNFARSGLLTLTAAADDDFLLLGTVNVQDGCTVQMAGAFRSRFGTVNVGDTASWINTVPNSTLVFVPGSTVLLQGSNSGTLTVDGQATSSRITVSTTTGADSFTINRGSSPNMTFRNVALSNCTYASNAGGAANAELSLTGVSDEGNNTNWFTVVSLDGGAGPDKNILQGRSTTLEGFATGGSGSYLYSWSPPDGLSAANVADPVASPAQTTVYTLTVTDAQDASKQITDTVTVTVSPAVVAQAGPDKTVILGRGTSLNGSALGGSGSFAYTWSPADGLDAADVATPTASPTETTTYTLTVTDLGDANRTSTDEVTVTVSPPVAASAGPDQWVASGQTFVLVGAAGGGSGLYAYSWSPTEGLDDPDAATTTGALLGYINEYGYPRFMEYTLTVTDLGDENRTATDTVTITVSPQPPDPCNLCGGGFNSDVCCNQLESGQSQARRSVPMLAVTLLGLCGLKCVQRGRRRW